MVKTLLTITLVIFSYVSLAQDFPQGKYTNAEMQMEKYDKDTSAHAVVLNEFGKTHISAIDGMPLIYEYHVRIKFFDNRGFTHGNVTVMLHHRNKDVFEKITNVKGTTFYKDDNGIVQKTEFDTDKVYHEKYNKYYDVAKFALPNLRKGCIIEYSYTISSPNRFNFHDWQFQSNIPKIHSEYNVHIPALYEYDIVLRGALKFTKNVSERERNCFSYYGWTADCTNTTYAMDNIPAFIEESYMTAASNYKAALYFELATYINDEGKKEKVTKEWKDIDYDLKHSESFGGQINRKELLKDRLPSTVLSITDTLAKARGIYAYLQKWFKWNYIRGIYSDDGIKKALDSHQGSIADINLALTAALNAGGIHAEAVILSTRDNGVVKKVFPVISDFDYVIARVSIGNKSYMLDATDPLLPFGLLPLRCINDQGRVISLNKPSYWINLVQPEKRNTISTLNLALQPNGEIKGTITTYSIGYAAYEKRVAIKKFNSTDEYVENFAGGLNRYKILKWDITGADSLDMPVTETYEVVINPSNNHQNIRNYTFDPAFWSRETINPFKLEQRSYPVDIASALSQTLSVTLTYPDNLIVSKQLAPMAIALPNNGGSFITNIDVQPGILKYSQIKQLSKSIYSPEEYLYLKEFYNKMIQNEKATIVFKGIQ